MARIQNNLAPICCGASEKRAKFLTMQITAFDYFPERVSLQTPFVLLFESSSQQKYLVIVTASFLAVQIVKILANLVYLWERMGGISRPVCVARRGLVKAGKVVGESLPFARK